MVAEAVNARTHTHIYVVQVPLPLVFFGEREGERERDRERELELSTEWIKSNPISFFGVLDRSVLRCHMHRRMHQCVCCGFNTVK